MQAVAYAKGMIPYESGKNLGLRGALEEWTVEAAIEDGCADLEHAVCFHG